MLYSPCAPNPVFTISAATGPAAPPESPSKATVPKPVAVVPASCFAAFSFDALYAAFASSLEPPKFSTVYLSCLAASSVASLHPCK